MVKIRVRVKMMIDIIMGECNSKVEFENVYEGVNSNSAGVGRVPGHLAASGSERDATGEREAVRS